MAITPDLVLHVARLAHLKLTEEELKTYTHQLGGILEHMTQLGQIQVDNIERTAYAIPLNCPTRQDHLEPSNLASAIVEGAPLTDGNYFIVPNIID